MTEADITPMLRAPADDTLVVPTSWATEDEEENPTAISKVITLDHYSAIVLVEGLEDYSGGGVFYSFDNLSNDSPQVETINLITAYPSGIVMGAKGMDYTDEEGKVYSAASTVEWTMQDANQPVPRIDGVHLINLPNEAPGFYLFF